MESPEQLPVWDFVMPIGIPAIMQIDMAQMILDSVNLCDSGQLWPSTWQNSLVFKLLIQTWGVMLLTWPCIAADTEQDRSMATGRQTGWGICTWQPGGQKRALVRAWTDDGASQAACWCVHTARFHPPCIALPAASQVNRCLKVWVMLWSRSVVTIQFVVLILLLYNWYSAIATLVHVIPAVIICIYSLQYQSTRKQQKNIHTCTLMAHALSVSTCYALGVHSDTAPQLSTLTCHPQFWRLAQSILPSISITYILKFSTMNTQSLNDCPQMHVTIDWLITGYSCMIHNQR